MNDASDGSTLNLERVIQLLDNIPEPSNEIVVRNPTLRKLWFGDKPSSRMWARMMRTGNYDPRKVKRMFRLVREDR